MYSACSLVTHLSKGCPYPRLYNSSPIIVYRAAFASYPLSVLGERLPILRYWMCGAVQLSVWPRLRQMFVVDGADNICCRRDLCLPLSLVLASLDNTFARTFYPLGMCWMCTQSKPDCMMLQTKFGKKSGYSGEDAY